MLNQDSLPVSFKGLCCTVGKLSFITGQLVYFALLCCVVLYCIFYCIVVYFTVLCRFVLKYILYHTIENSANKNTEKLLHICLYSTKPSDRVQYRLCRVMYFP